MFGIIFEDSTQAVVEAETLDDELVDKIIQDMRAGRLASRHIEALREAIRRNEIDRALQRAARSAR